MKLAQILLLSATLVAPALATSAVKLPCGKMVNERLHASTNPQTKVSSASNVKEAKNSKPGAGIQ